MASPGSKAGEVLGSYYKIGYDPQTPNETEMMAGEAMNERLSSACLQGPQ